MTDHSKSIFIATVYLHMNVHVGLSPFSAYINTTKRNRENDTVYIIVNNVNIQHGRAT